MTQLPPAGPWPGRPGKTARRPPPAALAFLRALGALQSLQYLKPGDLQFMRRICVEAGVRHLQQQPSYLAQNMLCQPALSKPHVHTIFLIQFAASPLS